MLGVPRLFGGHSLSQDMGFLLLPQLAQSRLWQQGGAVLLGPGTALHCRWQRGRVCHTLVIGGSQLVGMGARTMHKRMTLNPQE